MTLQETTQAVKEQWRQFLPLILEPAKDKANGETSYICPFCGHGTHGDGLTFDKKSKNQTGLKCFGCGFSGSDIDLYAKKTGRDISDKKTFAETVEEMAGMMGIEMNPEQSPTRHRKPRPDDKSPRIANYSLTEGTPDFTDYYLGCESRITDPEAAQYLSKRGISKETAAAYHLGYDSQADPANAPGGIPRADTESYTYYPHPAKRIIIPITRGHYIGRAIDPEISKNYAKLNNYNCTSGIFNEKVLYTQGVQEVFVCEGVFDALSVIEAGAAAIALDSVANVDLLVKHLESRPTKAELIICLDNDSKGQAAAERLKQGLERLTIPYRTADITGSYKDPNERLQADRAGLTEAVQEVQKEAEPETTKEILNSFLEDIYSEKYKPIATGIKSIDNMLSGGLLRQTLILLGAEPGGGKTALASQIFEAMAKAGQPELYFNLEMSRQQMLARSIARICFIDDESYPLSAIDILQGYKQTETTKEHVKQAVREYQETIADNLQYNPGNVGNNVTDILNYIDRAAQAAIADGKPAPNICIDYLQIMTGDSKEDSSEIIKRAVAGFKNYAIKYNAIVFCIMAQSRVVNNRNEATLSAGRDTSALEYTADLQLQLIREDDNKPNEVSLFVTKSRFTQTSMKKGLKFQFYRGQSYFKESGPGSFTGLADIDNPFAQKRY